MNDLSRKPPPTKLKRWSSGNSKLIGPPGSRFARRTGTRNKPSLIQNVGQDLARRLLAARGVAPEHYDGDHRGNQRADHDLPAGTEAPATECRAPGWSPRPSQRASCAVAFSPRKAAGAGAMSVMIANEGEDPKQHRHVAETRRHRPRPAGDEPVLGEPQYAHEDADRPLPGSSPGRRRGSVLRMPTSAARAWVLVVGIGDQRLADVIAGPGTEEAEAEVLAEPVEVLDGIVDQPGGGQHESEHSEDLNGQRAVSRIVEQHAEPERLDASRPRWPSSHHPSAALPAGGAGRAAVIGEAGRAGRAAAPVRDQRKGGE